jgi:hypothetical protein
MGALGRQPLVAKTAEDRVDHPNPPHHDVPRLGIRPAAWLASNYPGDG